MGKSFSTFKEAAVYARNKALEEYCVVLIQRHGNQFITNIEEIEESHNEQSPGEDDIRELMANENTLHQTLNAIGNRAREKLELERSTTHHSVEKETPLLVSGNIIELDD